ncbi:MAG: S41 family peptidase [Bacteriovoracaceae bacterium]
MKISRILLIALFVCFSANAEDKKSSNKKSRFEKLEQFNKVLFLIESQYYRPVDTQKLIQGAINGMLNTLDPHSAYLDEEILKKMNEDTEGQFGGLGIEVTQKDGVILVITPIEDSPAHKAGIQPGDKIVEINHESMIGLSLAQVIKKMRGKSGSKIVIGVLRDGVKGIKQYSLKRKIIKTQTVKSDIVEEDVIYVRLTQFSKGSAKQISNAIKKHRKKVKKPKGIILDLRFNPGGLLDEAVNVSSIFLEDGVVVSTEGRDPKNKDIRYVRKTGYKETELPVVVLINSSSASASEIVAGALQDTSRAIIMGETSFGKGSVQTIAKIDDKTGVKMTIAQYMTPSGKKIQAIGIKPDIEITDVEGDWLETKKTKKRQVREKDLRNHLTATIETEEEKKRRLQEEKERIAQKRKEFKMNKSKKAKSVSSSFVPHSDYLVHLSAGYIKSFKTVQKIIRK